MAKEDAKLDYKGIEPFEQSQGNADPVLFSGVNDPKNDMNAGIGFTQEEEVTEATDDATEEASDGKK